MAFFTFDGNPPFITLARVTVSKLNRGWNNVMALKQGDQAFDQFVGTIGATVTLTGTQHNVPLPDACTLLKWAGTTDATFSGLTGGRAARMVWIQHWGTVGKYLRFTHNDGGSLVTNKILWPSVIGQYIGYGGSVLLIWDNGSNCWTGHIISPGIPLDVAYAAGNYGAVGSGTPTWAFPSGATNLVTFTFWQRGNRVWIDFYATNTTTTGIAGVITNLTLTLPNGISCAKTFIPQLIDLRVNNVQVSGVVVASASSTVLAIYRQDRATMTIGAANNDASFSVSLPIS